MEITTSTTEYVPLRSVLRGSICHFESNLMGQLHVDQPLSSDSSFHLVPWIWIRLWLSYDLLFFRKISGREIAGVWKLAKLVTADWSTGDYQRWPEMSESDVNTSLYWNGLLVVLVLSGRISLKLVCIAIRGKISSVIHRLFNTW